MFHRAILYSAAAILAALALSTVALGQGGAPGGDTTSSGGNTGNNGGNTGNSGRQRQPSNNDNNPIFRRPIFVSGKVALPDGSAPPSSVKIERVCNASSRPQGYTDRKGHFSFDLARTTEIGDASNSGSDPFGSNNGGLGGLTGRTQGPDEINRLGGDERMFWGCELRAVLAGFRSESLTLNNIHYMDNPDVGTIIIHPMGKVDGLTVSATNAMAPKAAKKAYEKGVSAFQKKNVEQALSNLEMAVELYPTYAGAWYMLGKVYEQGNKREDAIRAYEKAIACDSKFIPPYLNLSWLAARDARWEKLSEISSTVQRLNPFEYPDAFYLGSLAHFQLKQWDAAEKEAREAIKIDYSKKYQRAHYVLGLALAQKEDYAASAEALKFFLQSEPATPDAAQIREQLNSVEAALREKQK